MKTIAFTPGHGLTYHPLTPRERGAAYVLIDDGKVEKNRYGAFGRQLTTQEIDRLANLDMSELVRFFQTLSG